MKELDLSNNLIGNISRKDFKGWMLESLNISGNTIVLLNVDMFKQLQNLKKIIADRGMTFEDAKFPVNYINDFLKEILIENTKNRSKKYTVENYKRDLNGNIFLIWALIFISALAFAGTIVWCCSHL